MTLADTHRTINRRRFLRLAGLAAMGVALEACSASQNAAQVIETATAPVPTAAPVEPTATATSSSSDPQPYRNGNADPNPHAHATPSATSTPTYTPTTTPTRGPLRVISLIHGPARTLVVDHVLQRFGIQATSIRVDLGEAVPDLRAYDAIIFAGGEYGPDAFEDPIFQAERERILDALEANVPILGICLGNQLIAYWLGGEVAEGGWEMGWLPVTPNSAGRADPLLAGLGDPFYGFLWHGDQVTRLPEGGVLLASTERTAVQAYRLKGRPVWGVQFNPQYDPVMAEEVIRGSSWLVKQGYDIDELVAIGYREYDDVAGKIFGNFFRIVLEGEGNDATPTATGTAGLVLAVGASPV
jgi:GMP synthase-like glutamine amidotransferase